MVHLSRGLMVGGIIEDISNLNISSELACNDVLQSAKVPLRVGHEFLT